MSKINLQKILKLTPQIWLKLGELVSNWVGTDALAGVMQNNTSGHAYKSRQYVKYKANQMRRFTKGEGKTFSDKEGYFYGKTYFNNPKAKKNKKGLGTGDRLKEYTGIPIASTDISKVNMTLTGRTLNALAPKTSDESSVTMSFKGIDPRIILGNQVRGYDITGLNDKNKGKVLDYITKKLDDNVKKEIKGKIVINIGK